MNIRTRFRACAGLAIAWALAAPAHAADPTPAVIDQIFSAWSQPDSPGAVLTVVRDGKVVHQRGYGQANLEHGVPITPATVFHVASVSKQFTAYAILLLAQEGKLSLDDPVRKHLPELKIEAPITIRHLMHHASGLRDQWDLLTLAGLRLDDSITENDLLGLTFQQKQLNFPPGEDSLYSNTGYTLMGVIVRRVSGQSLAAFAKERIFDPLGMKDTRFQESYGTLVKHRASSYGRNRDGSWRYIALSFSNTGATSLFTTAEDLVRWNANFDQPRAGDAATVAALLESGKTNAGRDLRYGGGLAFEPYRGVPVVAHGGADAGFRSYFMRLPQQKLAVMLLGNAANLSTGDLVRKVADLYLEGLPGVQPPKAYPPEVELSARDLAPYAGDYQIAPGRVLSLFVDKGKLMATSGPPPITLHASSGSTFFARAQDTTVVFPPTVGNQPVPGALWKQGDRELQLTRVPREAPPAEALRACAGDYYSEELRTLYSLEMRGDKLMVRYPRGVMELKPINRNVFIAGYPLGVFNVQRDAAGACQSLDATTGRVRNLKFERVKMPG